MANPSVQKGYTKIANELIEFLASFRINGNDMRILWVVIRKTWGWASGSRRKDWDNIPISQFAKMSRMKRQNVSRSLKSLESRMILLKSEKGYKINQNYIDWKESPMMRASRMIQEGITDDAKQESPMMISKEKKEIYQKKENANSFFEMREQDFLEFWNIYPRKMNEDFAREEFFKIDRNVFPVLMEGLKEYISGRAKENIHGGMKPNVWLRDQMWQFSSSSNENK